MLGVLIRRFHRDRRGGIAVISAAVLTGSLVAAGLVTDTALIYFHERKAQSAIDLAALVAARNIDRATETAVQTLADNGFPSPERVEVAVGHYDAAPALPPQRRFTAGSLPANAVSVRMVSRAPVALWPFVLGGDGPTVANSATAANTGMASLSIGSRLASLDGGVLNALLGALTGGNVSLTVMDYRTLLEAEVDLVDVLDQLALDLGVADDSYADLLDMTVGAADVAGALEDVLAGNGGERGAIAAVRKLGGGLGDSPLRLGELIDLGSIAHSPIGSDLGGLEVRVSSLDLLAAAARLAGGEQTASAAFDLAIPGVAAARVRLAIGEPMQHSGWMTVGAEGATVSTAQTRLFFDLSVGGTGALAGKFLSVPIYLEVAAGTATLKEVRCGSGEATSGVTIDARPGVAELWLADIDESRLPDFGTSVRPADAHLLHIPLLLDVKAYANVEVADQAVTSLAFTYGDIRDGVLKTAGTSDVLGPALSTLFAGADIEVGVLGLNLGLPGTAEASVAQLLGELTSPVDAVLNTLLRGLGVGIGEVDVRVGGIRCDGAALVL